MWLRQSTASQEILLGPFLDSTDGNTQETGLTIANTDIKLWKEGATTEANKNSGGATHIANGRYYAVLDATDTGTLGKLEVNVHVTGALAVRREFMVLPAMVYDSLVLGTDRFDVNVTHVADTAQTANDNGADINAILVDTAEIGAAGAGLTAVPWNAAWDAEVQSEANDALVAFFTSSAQLVDDFWDELWTGHNTDTTFGKAIRQIKEGLVSEESTVNDASATTTSFITALTEATDDHYKDVSIVFTDGVLQGQSRPISGYNGTTKTITVGEAFTDAPGNGDGFIIKTDHVHTIASIVAAVVADAVIAELTTQGDTNEAALTDLQTQIGTAGAGLTDLGGMSTTMKAQVNTEADTALSDYDPPTNAEMEARTPTAAQLAYIVANAATGKPVTFSGTGTTTSGTLALVDGNTPSSTDDQYKSRLLVFNAGTLNECVTDITAYNGTTKVATVTAVPVAITSSHTARLI